MRYESLTIATVEWIMLKPDDHPVAGIAAGVVILAIIVGRASWKKTNSGAHLAALLGLIIALWFIFAAGSPSGAGTLAADVAKSIMDLAVGLGKVIHQAPTA